MLHSAAGMEWSVSTVRLVILVSLAVVTIDIIRRVIYNRVERKGYRLPPGPTPIPVIGHTLSIDREQPWLTYTEWGSRYGDIMHVRIAGSSVIILNSPSAAMDLLERRSQIYSDRPFLATVDTFGLDCNFALSQYSDHWRLCRRIFQQTFRPDAALCFRPMQLRRAREMIVNLNYDPKDYPSHFLTFSASVAMSMVYDYEPEARDDPMVTLMDNFIHRSMWALTSWNDVLLKTFPFLLHIPDWFPGSRMKREAKDARTWRDRAVNTAYQYARKRLESQSRMSTAMVLDHITRMEHMDGSHRFNYETSLKHAAITAIIGSVETTAGTLMTFTLAMIENPHVWKRAHAEIEAVIGTDRLPDFDDRPTLPYVEAVVRETTRWKPVVPLAVAHATTRSDVYREYYIPEGATIIPNIWAMSRDEARYPDPEKFIPERFLDAEGMLTKDDPAEYIFGFGRRICPGRHAADASIWIGIATMLATLEFYPAKDADGNNVEFTLTFVNSLVHRPHTFPCQLTLRPHVSHALLDRVLRTE